MDQGPLVERQIDDGLKVVEKLRGGGFDVTAAWWMRINSDDRWFLYIASKQVDELGKGDAYGKLNSIIRSLHDLWVGPLDVKLVPPGNPFAQDIVAKLQRFGRFAARFGGGPLGNAYVAGTYVYLLPGSAEGVAPPVG